MTVERDQDSDATVKMPVPEVDEDLEDLEEIDPEKTLVRDDWESTAIRRIAPHLAAVQSQVAEESTGEARFGWESEGLRRLSEGLQRVRK